MKLSIKESCRYQNHLNQLINDLNRILTNQDYAFNIEENHNKSQVVKDALDEKKNVTKQREYDITLEKVVHIINDLYNEKLKLSQAINTAKQTLTIDYTENGEKLFLDSAIEYNKNTRQFADYYLKQINNYKASETEKIGYAQIFNNEGNVTQYQYPMTIVKTLDFDKKATTKLYKKIMQRCDIISEQIDQAMLEKVVDYTPKYDLQTTLEDIVE